jgi:hypothetical protein
MFVEAVAEAFAPFAHRREKSRWLRRRGFNLALRSRCESLHFVTAYFAGDLLG